MSQRSELFVKLKVCTNRASYQCNMCTLTSWRPSTQYVLGQTAHDKWVIRKGNEDWNWRLSPMLCAKFAHTIHRKGSYLEFQVSFDDQFNTRTHAIQD